MRVIELPATVLVEYENDGFGGLIIHSVKVFGDDIKKSIDLDNLSILIKESENSDEWIND